MFSPMVPDQRNIPGVYKLPPEILSIIFAQCAQSAGPALLSFSPSVPIQITISHVCSLWRRVVFGTGKLWADIYIRDPFKSQQIYKTWLSRAGHYPLSLTLNFNYDINSVKPAITTTFWELVEHVPIRRLGLMMFIEDFCDLWKSGQETLPYLERLDVQITVSSSSAAHMPFNIPTAIMDKILSATFVVNGPYERKVEWITRKLGLPWAQLRGLELHSCTALSHCISLLRQTPLLEHCSLNIFVDAVTENAGYLTLPHVQSLILNLTESGDHIDAVIRHFICPNLTLLDIEETSDWSMATWDMIRKQYNLYRLQDLSFNRFQPLSSPILSSIVFKDAPMLRNLNVGQVVIIDDETCAGIVTGVFGRFLRSLTVSCNQTDIAAVLGMVKNRQLTVAERLRPGYGWQDEMASLKQLNLVFLACTENPRTYEDEVVGLERLGVAVKISQTQDFDFD